MSNEFQRFDATVRKVLSVSHDELVRREKEWKRKTANWQRKSGLRLRPLPALQAVRIRKPRRFATLPVSSAKVRRLPTILRTAM